MAAIGGNMSEMTAFILSFKFVIDFCTDCSGSQRQIAAGQPLGHGHDIGTYPLTVHKAKHLAVTAKAATHLIHNQEHIMLLKFLPLAVNIWAME